jgi:hypothetical protein
MMMLPAKRKLQPVRGTEMTARVWVMLRAMIVIVRGSMIRSVWLSH